MSSLLDFIYTCIAAGDLDLQRWRMEVADFDGKTHRLAVVLEHYT